MNLLDKALQTLALMGKRETGFEPATSSLEGLTAPWNSQATLENIDRLWSFVERTAFFIPTIWALFGLPFRRASTAPALSSGLSVGVPANCL